MGEGREEAMGDLGERMRGETLKRGWVYGKIKDCQGRGRKGREREGGGVCERKNREKNGWGGC